MKIIGERRFWEIWEKKYEQSLLLGDLGKLFSYSIEHVARSILAFVSPLICGESVSASILVIAPSGCQRARHKPFEVQARSIRRPHRVLYYQAGGSKPWKTLDINFKLSAVSGKASCQPANQQLCCMELRVRWRGLTESQVSEYRRLWYYSRKICTWELLYESSGHPVNIHTYIPTLIYFLLSSKKNRSKLQLQ